MTREEAIKILDPKTCRDALMEYMGGTWHQEQALTLINEAQKMGLSALRAQQANAKLDRNRWEGCDYCNDPKPYRDCVLPDGTEQFLCSRDGLFGDCYINERSIQFCPMCGRPITEDAWEELERRINGGTVDNKT